LEASDLREVGLGEDIGARAEDLRELDEGRAEGGDRGRQSLRPPPMILGGAPGASTEDYPAPAVPHEGDEERGQAREDDRGAAPAPHCGLRPPGLTSPSGTLSGRAGLHPDAGQVPVGERYRRRSQVRGGGGTIRVNAPGREDEGERLLDREGD